jgi:transcriptional regulator with XRE-family HTH domain
MEMEPWAHRIYARLTKLGQTQAALAKACGISEPSISGWFGKASRPTRMIAGDNLVYAAKFLETTPEWIITGRGQADSAMPSHSQSMRLQWEIMRGVARAVQDTAKEMKVVLDSQQAIVLAAEMYERVGESGITAADVVWLVRRLEQGGG